MTAPSPLYPSSRLWRQFGTLVWCPMWSSLPLPSWSDYTSPVKWALRSRKRASACLLTSRPWWCTGVHGELATAGWFVVGGWLKIVSLYVVNQWDFDLRSFVSWPFHFFLYAKADGRLGRVYHTMTSKVGRVLGLGTILSLQTSFSY